MIKINHQERDKKPTCFSSVEAEEGSSLMYSYSITVTVMSEYNENNEKTLFYSLILSSGLKKIQFASS